MSRALSLGEHAEELLVLARIGTKGDGRPDLRLARVARIRVGVTTENVPALPFAPEIRHQAIRFTNVKVVESDLLDGDGWSRYVRPFRTVEDTHVHAAAIGHLLQVARRAGWPMTLRDDLITQFVCLRGLATADPSAAGVHVALAAAIARLKEWLRRLTPAHWERVDEPTRERWKRDRGLLDVAGKARAARHQKALERLGLT